VERLASEPGAEAKPEAEHLDPPEHHASPKPEAEHRGHCVGTQDNRPSDTGLEGHAGGLIQDRKSAPPVGSNLAV
jgi:hypothetical protein